MDYFILSSHHYLEWNESVCFLIYLLFYIQLNEKKGKNTPFR